MPFIGNKPTAVPLTGADIQDGTIQTADIADGAVTAVKTTGVGGANTPAFFAKLSSDQSVPTTTFTKIQVDTEQFDTDGTYDNSTNYRFTPGVAGKYLITANILLESMSDGKNFRGDIFKNGSSYILGRSDSSKAGSTVSVNFSFLDTASATDYYELYIYHNEGSNLNVGGSSDRRTSFGAIKIIE